MLDNTFERAIFAVAFLNGSGYTSYTIQYYAIGTGHASRLSWEHLKSNLRFYFKPPDYTYQIQVALLYCKQSSDITSYICIFLQHLNRCSDVEEIEGIFCFVKGLVLEIKLYIQLQQPKNHSESNTSGRISNFDLVPD